MDSNFKNGIAGKKFIGSQDFLGHRILTFQRCICRIVAEVVASGQGGDMV